jgi:hypothetical protein
MMEKKSEHRSGKAKTSKELKSPEPRKADK